MDTPEQEMLSEIETARLLNVSVTTLRQYVWSGKIKSSRIGTLNRRSIYVFHPDVVSAFIQKRTDANLKRGKGGRIGKDPNEILTLLDETDLTHQQIGRRVGLSRTRIHQISLNAQQNGRERFRKRFEKVVSDRFQKFLDGFMANEPHWHRIVREECANQELSFKPVVRMRLGGTHFSAYQRAEINTHMVYLRSSKIFKYTSGQYAHIRLYPTTYSKRRLYELVVSLDVSPCYFWIIPAAEIDVQVMMDGVIQQQQKTIYLPIKHESRSPWAQYLGAWDLLRS